MGNDELRNNRIHRNMTTSTAIGINPLPVMGGGSGVKTSTGTGNVVYANSPTFVTPTLGVATGTSIAFSPTTNGIVGTTAGDNASTGYVGEVVSASIAFASAVSVTSGSVSTITSVSLTAGDWDVYGNVGCTSTTTNGVTNIVGWTSTSSSAEPMSQLRTTYSMAATTVCNPVAYIRISIASTTSVYLGLLPTGSGTLTAFGTIWARRAR